MKDLNIFFMFKYFNKFNFISTGQFSNSIYPWNNKSHLSTIPENSDEIKKDMGLIMNYLIIIIFMIWLIKLVLLHLKLIKNY